MERERNKERLRPGRHRKGCLYRRGKVWWLKYQVGYKKDEDGKDVPDVTYESLDTESKSVAKDKRDDKMRSLLTADRADALAILAGRLNTEKTEADRQKDEANPPLTVSDAWAAFMDSADRPDSGAATLATYEIQWGCFVSWLYGKPPKGKTPKIEGTHPEIKFMRDVSKEIAGKYANSLLARGVTPNTHNKHVRVCQLVFHVLRDKAKILENPWAGITRKKWNKQEQRRRELSTAELEKICQSAKGELRVMLAIGLYTGARLADAATFDWSNFDLRRGWIKFTPRKTARQDDPPTLNVPLHPVLHGILSETLPTKRRGPVLPKMARLYENKGPWAVTRIVQAHFVNCGIATTREGKKGVRRVVSAGFHSLRHSAVSLLREAGAPLSVTMAIVGHSSLSVHDGYTHTGEAAMQRAIAALPSVMADAKPVKALSAPHTVPADSVRALADQLTTKNAAKIRKELLALTEANEANSSEMEK